MGRIEIRTADGDDVPALRLVFRDASWSNEGDRALLTAHPEFLELSSDAVMEGRTRVVTEGGEIRGFASVIDRGAVIELEDLFVDPAHMRRGVARALIDDVVARARAAGATTVEVDGNEHALAFYARVGFRSAGPVTLEHGTAVRMVLQVGRPIVAPDVRDAPEWRDADEH